MIGESTDRLPVNFLSRVEAGGLGTDGRKAYSESTFKSSYCIDIVLTFKISLSLTLILLLIASIDPSLLDVCAAECWTGLVLRTERPEGVRDWVG